MSKINVIFKKCTEEDLPETIALCNTVFDEKTDPKCAREIFLSTQNDPNQIYLNGAADGKIVSHVKITVVPTMYGEMGTYAVINHFCVHPDYRRHHIAWQMLDEVTRISRAQKCKSIKLWSKNFRAAAHALYKHFGFAPLDAGFFEKSI